WLRPSSIARASASRSACGPSKSGNPWPRLIALWLAASWLITVKIVVPTLGNFVSICISPRRMTRTPLIVHAPDDDRQCPFAGIGRRPFLPRRAQGSGRCDRPVEALHDGRRIGALGTARDLGLFEQQEGEIGGACG